MLLIRDLLVCHTFYLLLLVSPVYGPHALAMGRSLPACIFLWKGQNSLIGYWYKNVQLYGEKNVKVQSVYNLVWCVGVCERLDIHVTVNR